MRKIFAALLLFATACAPAAPQDSTSNLIQHLRSTSHVQFFLVSRTEEYDYSEKELVDESSVRIDRSCGGNCARFMDPVLKHLHESVERKCLKGQQDVLIRIGAETSIVYSYSGRHVKVGSRCFFNKKQGIQEVLRTPWFLF